jgi:DNA-binding response OmpR family regulator
MLPCSPADFGKGSQESPSVAAGRERSESRKRLLRAMVVEDADDTRELYASELENAGFVVARASSGETALSLAQEFEPDVIVLDLMLPGVNGFTVARAVRVAEKHPGALAIVAVTALTSDAMRRLALESGCDTVLSKPVVPTVVIDEARLLLKRRERSQGDGH